jgi:hypothetical protein
VLTHLPTQDTELHCLNYNPVVPVSRTDELLMDGPAYYVTVFPRELNCMIHRWYVQGSHPRNKEVRDITQRLAVMRLISDVTFLPSFIYGHNKLNCNFITGLGYD